MGRWVPDPPPAGGPLPSGNHGRMPEAPRQHSSRPGCCAMAEAGRAVRRGKFRLARRYTILAARLVAARVAS